MVRIIQQDDIPAVRELMRSVPGVWRDDWRPDVLEQATSGAGSLSFVWEGHGKILGFVCAHDVGFRAYLSELIVHESVRNAGIGQKLVTAVEMEVSRRGCTVLFADVWRDAERFYRNMGWSAPDVVC
jgi:predicted N-acetyltransferase YhbS